MKPMIVAPSLLSADFSKLDLQIKCVEDGGAEFLHFDIMDGHFVENISFGAPLLKSVHNIHKMVNDVHLMISDPMKYIPAFAKAGADIITVHYECFSSDEDVYKAIDLIHSLKKKAGLCIKPKTPAEVIFKFLPSIELVLVMTVEPGFGGQEFMDDMLPKILALRQRIDFDSLNTLIEVDGGINIDTAKKAAAFGADVLVAGTYIFGHPDTEFRIEMLRSLA